MVTWADIEGNPEDNDDLMNLLAAKLNRLVDRKDLNGNHTLLEDDGAHLLVMAEEGDFTVPADVLPVNSMVVVTKSTGDNVNVIAGSGVTFLPETASSYAIPGEWVFITLFHALQNTWVVQGIPESIESDFVQVNGVEFVETGEAKKYAGTNMYHGPNYEHINPSLVSTILDSMQTAGVNIIRTWGFYDGPPQFSGDITIQPSPGVYDENGLQALDRFIAKCKGRGIRVLLPFVNYWQELGGIIQYNVWAGESEPEVDAMHKFITGEQQQMWFTDYISMLLNRVNTETGIAYKDEPAIFGLEVGNECRNPFDAGSGVELRDWYQEIAQYIKSIDSNHLVGTGEEGLDENTPPEYQEEQYSNTYALRAQEGTSYILNTAIPEIDFGSCHWYGAVFGFAVYDPDLQFDTNYANAQQAWLEDHHSIAAMNNKPVMIGEYGFPGYGSQHQIDCYRAYYNTIQETGIQSTLLWQYTPNGLKATEFGGNIAFPEGREDVEMYNDYATHLNLVNTGTIDTIPPTPPEDDSLSFSNITGASFSVSFNKAADNKDLESQLKYSIYTSLSDNLDTDAETVENNGILQDSTYNVDSFLLTGLSPGTTYYVNIVVEDAAGNKSIYTSNNTETSSDINPPVVPEPELSATDVDVNNFTINFTKADDNETADIDLVYNVYISLVGNLDTDAETVESNGILVGTLTGETGTNLSIKIDGLMSGTTYYFNIVVVDTFANKTIYDQNSQQTDPLSTAINPSHPTAQDLEVYFQFNEDDGTVVNDITGNQRNAVIEQTNPATWEIFDSEVVLHQSEGNEAVVHFPHDSDLEPGATGAITIGIFFGFTENNSINNNILSAGGNPNGITILNTGWNDDFLFRLGNDMVGKALSPLKNDGEIHQLVIAVDLSVAQYSVYLDGTVEIDNASFTVGSSLDNRLSSWYLGNDLLGTINTQTSDYYWNRFAIWMRKLTDQEVLDWYNNKDLMLL